MSYEIHPDTPAEGVPLERMFGAGVGAYQEMLGQRARELGLPFEAPLLLSNTRLAVEAAEFARDAGRHAEFHRAVMAAYFVARKDVGDIEVLLQVGESVGLDPAALLGALATDVYADRRRAAELEARRLGITGVPTYVFADGTRIVGAQPLDHFRRIVAARVADGT